MEEPKVSTRQSDAYRKESLKLYQIILKSYPAYERKDEVLFVGVLERYKMQVGYAENGRRAAGKLLRPHWDAQRQEFRVGRVVVKQFKVPAENIHCCSWEVKLIFCRV